jgi:hypothetical protein
MGYCDRQKKTQVIVITKLTNAQSPKGRWDQMAPNRNYFIDEHNSVIEIRKEIN